MLMHLEGKEQSSYQPKLRWTGNGGKFSFLSEQIVG